MAAKYLVNSVDDCVRDSLYGFSRIRPDVHIDPETNVVLAGSCYDGQRVAVVAGGGSGHEPFPSGYVGAGMLTASVSGSIFASPPSASISRAIRASAENFDEVLVLVANYTGDVLNFGLASEVAKAEGIAVDTLVIGEDIAQESYGYSSKAGKRGACGLVLCAKIAGYLAGNGETSARIRALTSEAANLMATLGLCTRPCGKPGSTGELFHLDEEEVEVGVGVHGEAGVSRMKSLTAADAVRRLLSSLTAYLKLERGDRVVAVVNNLGSLTHLEEWLIAGELDKQVSEMGVSVLRLYAGTFFTSLNMTGVQITLLKLTESVQGFVLEALDSPTDAPAWTSQTRLSGFPGPLLRPLKLSQPRPKSELSESSQSSTWFRPGRSKLLKDCLMELSKNLIESESRLNQLDSSCGDGDCGTTLKALATAILSRVRTNELDLANWKVFLTQMCQTSLDAVGGTTGALYGLFFRGASNELRKLDVDGGDDLTDSACIAKTWRAGVETIKAYSKARLGDRTMLDSLESGCQAFQRALDQEPELGLAAFERAVEAAEAGCRQTRCMRATVGRASYTDPTTQTNDDAGARGVTIWLSAILNVLQRPK